ncbi:Sigma-70 region 2 [Paenibacillus sp. PDC88]|nr:Sigma-70 region 2 [Paenibacillus sp. PDC88]
MTERELFDSYHKDVYRTCYYMLRHAQDAEDACHDIFITVFRQQQDFAGNGENKRMDVYENYQERMSSSFMLICTVSSSQKLCFV